MRLIQGQYPGAEIYLLLGADMFLKFRQWRFASELLRCVTLAALRRGEKKEAAQLESEARELMALGGKVILLENPVVSISSTQVRRLLAFRAGDEFLHPEVLAYIRREKLYDTAADFRNLPMERLEPVVIRLLNPNRVKHVLGLPGYGSSPGKALGSRRNGCRPGGDPARYHQGFGWAAAIDIVPGVW